MKTMGMVCQPALSVTYWSIVDARMSLSRNLLMSNMTRANTTRRAKIGKVSSQNATPESRRMRERCHGALGYFNQSANPFQKLAALFPGLYHHASLVSCLARRDMQLNASNVALQESVSCPLAVRHAPILV